MYKTKNSNNSVFARSLSITRSSRKLFYNAVGTEKVLHSTNAVAILFMVIQLIGNHTLQSILG